MSLSPERVGEVSFYASTSSSSSSSQGGGGGGLSLCVSTCASERVPTCSRDQSRRDAGLGECVGRAARVGRATRPRRARGRAQIERPTRPRPSRPAKQSLARRGHLARRSTSRDLLGFREGFGRRRAPRARGGRAPWAPRAAARGGLPRGPNLTLLALFIFSDAVAETEPLGEGGALGASGCHQARDQVPTARRPHARVQHARLHRFAELFRIDFLRACVADCVETRGPTRGLEYEPTSFRSRGSSRNTTRS